MDVLRVLLVDDHTFFRAGLRNILADEGFEVAEAMSGAQALDVVAARAPDVVLMDLHMPGMSGIEATRRLLEVAPGARVVMLTVSADQNEIVEAVLAGACGYLLKDASIEEIVGSMRAAVAGASWASPNVAAVLFDRVRAGGEPEPTDDALAALSDRERDILRLLADGRDNAEIGRELYISPSTVKNHICSERDGVDCHCRRSPACPPPCEPDVTMRPGRATGNGTTGPLAFSRLNAPRDTAAASRHLAAWADMQSVDETITVPSRQVCTQSR